MIKLTINDEVVIENPNKLIMKLETDQPYEKMCQIQLEIHNGILHIVPIDDFTPGITIKSVNDGQLIISNDSVLQITKSPKNNHDFF